MTSILYFLLFIQVLKDTGVFEYTLSEVELWLEQLARLEPNQQETVIPFLERASLRFLHPCLKFQHFFHLSN